MRLSVKVFYNGALINIIPSVRAAIPGRLGNIKAAFLFKWCRSRISAICEDLNNELIPPSNPLKQCRFWQNTFCLLQRLKKMAEKSFHVFGLNFLKTSDSVLTEVTIYDKKRSPDLQ